MEAYKRLGILGGTFDPIHNGHITVAQDALEKLDLDEVIFIPNHIPPHKKHNNYVNNDYHRYHMVRLAIKGHPNFRISNIEQKCSGKSYTYITLKKLKEYYTNSDLYFIMGDDSFFSFETWKNPHIICKNANLVIGKRNLFSEKEYKKQAKKLKEKFDANVIFLTNNMVFVSSSEIRNNEIKEEDLKEFLPKDVYAYIQENHLYENKF